MSSIRLQTVSRSSAAHQRRIGGCGTACVPISRS